jgi:hypothetical protein
MNQNHPPIFVNVPVGPRGYAQSMKTYAQVRSQRHIVTEVKPPSAAVMYNPQYQYPQPLWQQWWLPTPFVGTDSLLPVGQTQNFS